MPLSALSAPHFDPSAIFDLYRGNMATELLTAAVAHFKVFDQLAAGPQTGDELRNRLGLAERPFTVLLTALRAMGLVVDDGAKRLEVSELAREHLVADSPFDMSGYIRQQATNPGVLTMVERLRTNQPADADTGAAFIFREGIKSAMEQEDAARTLTLALAGRARAVAAVLAERVPLNPARLLLDVGGGTGLYSIACLQKNRQLRAIVWDRPQVLKVAAELAVAHSVSDRLECRPGDMFTDAVPAGVDVVLLSNILHDWDVPECRKLVRRCADALSPGGRLLIHDVYLHDELDGPLPLALYSAQLFCQTEGRAYSAAEYRSWLTEAGLTPGETVPTLVQCGVLPGIKPQKR
jgi:SAM-dependent methyltransferase